jgi:meiotically up-regulated gene 157 (Mug157) protein
LISGVINRTAFYINYDPYANAYSFKDGGVKSQVNCEGCYGYVAEWKYEVLKYEYYYIMFC